eukprot:CAMPEP_0172451738 /NCGR_PEP_ID=MMETSP1065-20121228/9647_1 /TAXON_ID=265537 /ORGANISM="Amphiprora paludosa, Strain CCMP125" /LENGTH=356 /DNA_ID=CAMNT_0013203709 /DNA_START=296 /DNA_END=1366 /DNA_ORIENTATION=-
MSTTDTDEQESSHDQQQQQPPHDFVTPPIYYFGFGAMANPISRQRRSVVSRYEQPAVLPHYELLFVTGGIATISPRPQDSSKEVHGILMELTQAGWESMIQFEMGYDIVQVTVIPYEGTTVYPQVPPNVPIVANMFRLPDASEQHPCAPEERYIKIISQGLRTYGALESYIESTILNSGWIPNAKREDYQKFPIAKVNDDDSEPTLMALSEYTWEEYQQLHLEKPSFVFGNRVYQFPHGHPDNLDERNNPQVANVWKWMTLNILGRDCSTWKFWNTLYDPDLPPVASPEELTTLHQEWAEHHLGQFLLKCHVPELPQVIGRLKQNESTTSCDTTTTTEATLVDNPSPENCVEKEGK